MFFLPNFFNTLSKIIQFPGIVYLVDFKEFTIFICLQNANIQWFIKIQVAKDIRSAFLPNLLIIYTQKIPNVYLLFEFAFSIE